MKRLFMAVCLFVCALLPAHASSYFVFADSTCPPFGSGIPGLGGPCIAMTHVWVTADPNTATVTVILPTVFGNLSQTVPVQLGGGAYALFFGVAFADWRGALALVRTQLAQLNLEPPSPARSDRLLEVAREADRLAMSGVATMARQSARVVG